MRLSKHFELWEFRCRDPEQTPVPVDLLPDVAALVTHVLEPIRRAWGGPLKVVSGYRTPDWNAIKKGARRSQHLRARAADIRPARPESAPVLCDLIDELERAELLPKLGGVGRYRRFVHVDIRARRGGRITRWSGPGVT